MPNYTTTVSATSNATAGTEDAFVDVTAAAGSMSRCAAREINEILWG